MSEWIVSKGREFKDNIWEFEGKDEVEDLNAKWEIIIVVSSIIRLVSALRF